MNFSQISDKFKQLNENELPGFLIQQKMSPPFRRKLNLKQMKILKARESAVLILLYEKNNIPYLVFIERKIYKGAHSGQISFPGGKKDAEDFDFIHTAKRETFEEVGIVFDKIEILSPLSQLYIPVSNFIVYPYVAKYNGIPNFKKEEAEVENIIEVSIPHLLQKDNQASKIIKMKNSDFEFTAPSYNVNNVEIWGATAMILSEFLHLVEN